MKAKHQGVMRFGAAAALSIVLAGAAVAVSASTLSISPVRIELAGEQRTQALRIRNQQPNRPVLVQAQVFAWSQQDGEDVLVPTREVLATPPVFTLEPGEQQLVRVAVRSAAAGDDHCCFRLLLQEVPARDGAPEFGLQVALRFSLPVFVAPSVRRAPVLEWEATLASDAVHVQVTNGGSAPIQITGFALHPQVGEPAAFETKAGRYVLPGSTITWSLPALAAPASDRPWRLVGITDRGPIEAELPIGRP
jgi:fimbrial chaperone protein